MGTYTTNYNLFLPTVGEQGWGELVNGNFTTIDTTMKSLSNRITAVENEVNGALSCTSVTTSGTITSTGKITANGGIGTKALTTTSISNSGNMTNTGTLTSTGLITANGGVTGNYAEVNHVKIPFNLSTSKAAYGITLFSVSGSVTLDASGTGTVFDLTIPNLSNYNIGFGTKLGTLKNTLNLSITATITSNNGYNDHTLYLNDSQIYYYEGSDTRSHTFSISVTSNTRYKLTYKFSRYHGWGAVAVNNITVYANPL